LEWPARLPQFFSQLCIFFTRDCFDDFKTDEDVELEFIETERGLFAKSLSKTAYKTKFQPEAVV
jgi:hypothetical protein